MPRTKKTTPADKHIGHKLRALRIERKLSQGQLGESLGVSFQQVQKYEKGLNRIGAGRLSDIAKVLSAPESYFFEGLGRRGKAHSYEEGAGLSRILTERHGAKMVEAYLALSEPHQRAVTSFVVRLSGITE